MIEDFIDYKDKDAAFNADICIIGAGVAGITLTQALQGSGYRILLLESGGKDYDQATQDLAAGTANGGIPYYRLEDSRLRFFGGTCAIWGGRVAELDEEDFEKRAWVPHSGWPFSKDVLRPYYDQARTLLDLPVLEDNTLPGYKNPFDPALLQPAFWQFDEHFDRFTLGNSGNLKQAHDIHILLNANVTRLCPHESGTSIKWVEIANLKGGKATVTAQFFVLAAGGMEVPRLLLASHHPAHPNGIGNHHDLVGRFFMEHPHGRGAQIFTEDPAALFRALPRFIRRSGRRYGLLLRPGTDLQSRAGILNTGFTLAVRKHAGEKQILYKQLYNTMRHDFSPTQAGRTLWQISRRAATATQDHMGAFLNTRKLRKNGYGLYAVLRAEQAPNAESRIILSNEKDMLGMPRIKLNWQLSDIDRHSASGAMNALNEALQKTGLGRAETAPWLADNNRRNWEFDPLVSNHPIGGYHHMGTARMATSPREGVTDENTKIHGIENLYIAGSALFPTGGWANPTLTIIALSLKLADYFKRKTLS